MSHVFVVCFPVAIQQQLIRIFPQSEYKSTMTCSSPCTVLSTPNYVVTFISTRTVWQGQLSSLSRFPRLCNRSSHLHPATTGGRAGPIRAARLPVQPITARLSPRDKETKEFGECQMFVLYLFWQVLMETIKIILAQNIETIIRHNDSD